MRISRLEELRNWDAGLTLVIGESRGLAEQNEQSEQGGQRTNCSGCRESASIGNLV